MAGTGASGSPPQGPGPAARWGRRGVRPPAGGALGGARGPPAAAGAAGSAMAAAGRLMALAVGVSPLLRLPGPRAAGRPGRSRGLSSGCAHPDRAKEAEAEAPERDGSAVAGEGGGPAA